MTILSIGVFGKDEGIDFRRVSKVSIVQTVVATWGRPSDIAYAKDNYRKVSVDVWKALALKESRVLLCEYSDEHDYLDKMVEFLCEKYPQVFKSQKAMDKAAARVEEGKRRDAYLDTLTSINVAQTISVIKNTFGGKLQYDYRYRIPGAVFEIQVTPKQILFDGYTIPAGYTLSSDGLEEGRLSMYDWAYMTDSDRWEERTGFNADLPLFKEVLKVLSEINGFTTKGIDDIEPKVEDEEE